MSFNLNITKVELDLNAAGLILNYISLNFSGKLCPKADREVPLKGQTNKLHFGFIL